MKHPAPANPMTGRHAESTGSLKRYEHPANSGNRHESRSRLLPQVEEAARVIAPLWPLSTFIAVNPLWDLRQMSFHDAIGYAAPILGIRGYPAKPFFADAYACGRVTRADLHAAMPDDGISGTCISDADIHHATVEDRHLYSLDAAVPEVAATSSVEVRRGCTNETLPVHAIDREVTKWYAAYVGGALPGKTGDGFYRSWRGIVGSDPAARRIAGREGRRRLAAMPKNAIDAVLECLDKLSIAENDRVWEMERRFARTLGWSGYAKWQSYWAGSSGTGPSLTMVDLLAVRLSYEAVLSHPDGSLRPTRSAAPFRRPNSRLDTGSYFETNSHFETKECKPGGGHLSADAPKRAWLAAYENHYRDWLLKALDSASLLASHTVAAGEQAASKPRPTAQAVFCIDTRSEGIRRHLEAAGRYETIGFAGFFSLPMKYLHLGSAGYVEQYPVLLSPAIQIVEAPSSKAAPLADRRIAASQGLAAAGYALNSARKGMLPAFILAEAGGFFAGPLAAVRTLTPRYYQKLRDWTHRMIVPRIETHIECDNSIPVAEQASFAENLLTTMGLTRHFAPLVLLCGHGSTTENNPHASSLDCGACGGNRGAANARAAATLLNQPAVRDILRERKIIIPDDTVFIAGEHDTATDEVAILDLHLIPSSHLDMAAALQTDLDRAGAKLAAERTSSLPGTHTSSRLALPAVRSADWAQVQPEWGLARNAAFIVAPRDITAGVNLDRRCFLHSYDSDVDSGGTVLETILTAPMVVAHWINAQYYFSTVDPEVLSAGDKTAHNIVAGVGVLQGAAGDLQVGLPLQSIFDGNRPFHEPMRLLTVVQAPQERLESIIARHALLSELFDGCWVHLVARDNPHDRWKIRRPGGGWKDWEPAE